MKRKGTQKNTWIVGSIASCNANDKQAESEFSWVSLVQCRKEDLERLGLTVNDITVTVPRALEVEAHLVPNKSAFTETMRAARVGRELEQLARDPPPGVAVWPREEDGNGGERLDVLDASLDGPKGSPFEEGRFRLEVLLPRRYPMEPPVVRFLSKVFHPNVDGQGRICLDSLKMPPKGAWQPSLNVAQILLQIRLLLAEPNPEDPLVPEISDLMRRDRDAFERKARDAVQIHALKRKKDTQSPSKCKQHGKRWRQDSSESSVNEHHPSKKHQVEASRTA